MFREKPPPASTTPSLEVSLKGSPESSPSTPVTASRDFLSAVTSALQTMGTPKGLRAERSALR